MTDQTKSILRDQFHKCRRDALKYWDEKIRELSGEPKPEQLMPHVFYGELTLQQFARTNPRLDPTYTIDVLPTGATLVTLKFLRGDGGSQVHQQTGESVSDAVWKLFKNMDAGNPR